jgi:spore coat polysaccharide biosynthesis predicted glycosyltransferase SpsG
MSGLMSKKYKVLFIGKGGASAGMGHLVRLDTLMREFIPNFDVSVLVDVDDVGRFFLDRRGIDFIPCRDSEELLAFLKRVPPFDIVVVDVYPPSERLLASIRNHCHHLLCFDDMGHLTDEKIDAVWIRPQETFNNKITSRGKSTVVMGSDYFPLRPDMIASRRNKRLNGQVKNIAVILGGAPQTGMNFELARLLDRVLDKNISLHVVLGFEPTQEEMLPFPPRVFSLGNVDKMGNFINRMDMGIIAGGFVKFEFMCIGTPFAMISLCSHQQKLGRKFSSQGYGNYWGHIKDCLADPEKLKKKVLSFIADEKMRNDISARSRELVDGHGSLRIHRMAESLIQGEKIG